MANSKLAVRSPQQPLSAGQVWRMAELNLQVGMVGKLLVHYKLAKPNAVRIPNLVGSIVTVEKYLKKNKAVLAEPPAPVAPALKTGPVKKTNGAAKSRVPAKLKK